MGRLESESPFPTPRADGQLWAVRILPDGRIEEATDPTAPGEGWVWAHYDLLSAGSSDGLARCALPEKVRALFIDPDESVQFRFEPEWFAGIVPDFEHGCDPDDVRTGALRLFVTERRLVSAGRALLQSVHQIWRSLPIGTPPSRPELLVQRLRRAFVDELVRLAGALQHELDAVEDDLLETEGATRRQARAGPRLGRVRQRIARLQRVTKPLARIEPDEGLPAWMDRVVFESSRRRTLVVFDDLQAVQDRSHALQDELNARQNEHANRRLYVLAVVTSVLAPTTLVTGFFGMNTGGMPWTHLPHGTWLASGLLAASIGVTVWLLRRGGLL